MTPLPKHTSVLIVGGGPSGLACAISLIAQDRKDIVIVDAVLEGKNSSRAMVVHAATLEALDSIGCAKQLIDLGIKSPTMTMSNRTGPLLTVDYTTLPQTPFPYALVLPQNLTESSLNERLDNLGVHVYRPYKVVSIKESEKDDSLLDVFFESGEVMQTQYIVGADGSHSIVRQLSGIGFSDPDGDSESNAGILSQMVLADVIFEDDLNIPLPTKMNAIISDNLFLLLPLPQSFLLSQNVPPEKKIYRIGCGIPLTAGPPPHAPSTDYLQNLVDKYGPAVPPRIVETLWATRFRCRSAIADKVFTRFNERGAPVILIGDAAHIHSPAGGQGMNLGIRDAVFLGPVLAEHMELSQGSSSNADAVLQEYASTRHLRALTVIGLTKELLATMGATGPWWFPFNFYVVRDWMVWFMGLFSFVKKNAAWRVSGLGTR